jgi:hypothetical protein
MSVETWVAAIGFGGTIIAALVSSGIAAYQSYKTRQETKELAELNAKLQAKVDHVSTRLDEQLKQSWRALELTREIHRLALSLPEDSNRDIAFRDEWISLAVYSTELEALAQANDDQELFELIRALSHAITLRQNPRLRDTLAKGAEQMLERGVKSFEEIVETQAKYEFVSAVRAVYRRIYERMKI